MIRPRTTVPAAAIAGAIALAATAPGIGPRAAAQAPQDLAVTADRTISGIARFGGGHVGAGATLTLDPQADVTLVFTANLVVEGAIVSHPLAGVRHTIRFEGIDEAAIVGGTSGPVATDVGLWVFEAGRLDLVGAPKTSWTRLAGGALAGDREVVLSAPPVGWEPGDSLVVAPTVPPTENDFATGFDSTRILAVDGRRVVLDAPLGHDHPAVGGRWTAEAFVLDRNVVLEGTPTGRAHIWISSSRPQRLANVEIRHMGPARADDPDASVLGRYPLHFHHSHEGSRGSRVEDVVVHHSGNRAFVAHASHGVTFEGTVAYDVTQTPYWWDPPVRIESPRGIDRSNDSQAIVYHRALAALVRASPTFRGYRLAGFQVNSGENLALTDSVAVGIQGNKNSSGFHWPENEENVPWTFERNLAHNNRRDGIFTWQNTPDAHRIAGFVAYHNGGNGVEHGAYSNPYRYEDMVLYGNLEAGILLHAVSRQRGEGLVFRCVDIEGAGLTRVGVRIDRSPVDGGPAHLDGVSMQGLSGPPFELTDRALADGDSLETRVAASAADCPGRGEGARDRQRVLLPFAARR